ncbi:MAG: hypothetical protein N2235_18085 [Fischerella sp.]|nr:hypothetical protein [Fischerella sp.]
MLSTMGQLWKLPLTPYLWQMKTDHPPSDEVVLANSEIAELFLLLYARATFTLNSMQQMNSSCEALLEIAEAVLVERDRPENQMVIQKLRESVVHSK